MFDIDVITHHALVAWLWSEIDHDGEPMDANYTVDDIAECEREEWRDEVEQFVQLSRAALRVSKLTDEQIGHDFTLTRNGHGAGFWDRGLGFSGDVLTNNANSFMEVSAYVGDDGSIGRI